MRNMTVETSHQTEAGRNAASSCQLWLQAYRDAVSGRSRDRTLQDICAGLATELGMKMVAIAVRNPAGTINVVSASTENRLWIEWQRLPERWDGTVTGDGPAARALHTGAPCTMPVTDEAYAPWRRAAESDGVLSAMAWPVPERKEGCLLLAFSPLAANEISASTRSRIQDHAGLLGEFLDNADRLAEQQLLAAALNQAGNACFVTDVNGTFVWSNDSFSRLSGYGNGDLRGKTPKILQSGKQGLRYYRDLWSTIRSGKTWTGETVDRRRDGSHYTIRQTVSPFGTGDRITHYLSVHDDISQQKAEQLRTELAIVRDPLSGLLTRPNFEQAVAETCERHESFVLVLLSMREFCARLRAVSVEAHSVVMAEIGIRIRALVGKPSLSCRSGDGEFLVLLRGADAAPDHDLITRLKSALAEPYPFAEQIREIDVRTAGVRFPVDGANPEDLFRKVDRLLADRPVASARRTVHHA
jgi:PAS domain S-box-containing protein